MPTIKFTGTYLAREYIMTRTKAQITGKNAEDEAEAYLSAHGLTLLQRNYRQKIGEIDLIMQDQEHLVFVEVRARKEGDHGNALESITESKRSKIIRTAKYYLQENNLYYKATSRFDVVTLDPIDGEWKLEWIRNAFGHDGF